MGSESRLKTSGEGLYGLVKIAYSLVALPFLLIVGTVTISALMSDRAEARISGLPLFSALVWLAIVLPIFFHVRGKINRSKLLKNIVVSLKSTGYFDPDQSQEMFSASSGKYLGIDTKSGTILYVHRIRKGQVDVVGMTMGDWTNREVEGNVLRLYTKFPELPRIEIATPWAQRWYDTLGAMEYKRYSTPKPFSEYVRDHVQQLERDHQIRISNVA